jgi:long-chain fatty acid transport protein
MNRLKLFVCLLLLAAPLRGLAGGLYITEAGTPSQGTADAGSVALATDASTALHNPAGMTRLKGHQLMSTAEGIYTSTHFDVSSSSPTTGPSGGQQGGFSPGGSLSYVHDLSDRWRGGLALFSLSATGLDPSNDWAGRNQMTKVTLFTFAAAPSLAYRATDRLSLSAGPMLWYATLDFNLRAPVGAEPFIKAKDADDWAWAWQAAALFEVNDRLRFGVQYLSEADLDLDGSVRNLAGAAANIDLQIDMAQMVRYGVYFDVTDRLGLMFSGDWEDWSSIEDIPISVTAGSSALPLGWDDTWKLSGGVHYRLRPDWMLQAGVSYDSSPVDSDDRIALLPVDRQWRYAVGAQHQWSETTTVGFSFEYVDLGNSQIRNTVIGDYKKNELYAFAFNVNWAHLPWDGRLRFGKKDWQK